MSMHSSNVHEGIDKALTPLEPHGELHRHVSDTADTIQDTGRRLKELGDQIADIGDKAVALVGVIFPEKALRHNDAATGVIDRSFDILRDALRGTHNGMALKGLERLGEARNASLVVSGNIEVGGRELAQQIGFKVTELLTLVDMVADRGLQTTILDQGSLERMAAKEAAPPFQAVAGPIAEGVSLLRQYQQTIE